MGDILKKEISYIKNLEMYLVIEMKDAIFLLLEMVKPKEYKSCTRSHQLIIAV